MGAKPDRILAEFLDLVRIPSPALAERKIADHITCRAETLGYEVVEDNAGDMIGSNAGNLIVRAPGKSGGPRLVFSAHMDTVEDGSRKVRPSVEGYRVVSDGATILGADDKAGVAVMLELLARLKEDNLPHGDLLFIFTICEENELLGTTALNPEWYAGYDAGIVLDHGDPREVIIGGPSKVMLRITVRGIGGHGAQPEGTVNAAHALSAALSRLPSGRLDSLSTACLGVMRAGRKVNIVPEVAYAEYEIRSQRKDLLDHHLKRAIGIIEGAVREKRSFVLDGAAGEEAVCKATVDLEVEACYEAFRHREDALPVRLMDRALKACGLEPVFIAGSGGTDAHNFNSRGLPSVACGVGMHDVHCNTEYLDVAEMKKAVEVLLRAIRPDPA